MASPRRSLAFSVLLASSLAIGSCGSGGDDDEDRVEVVDEGAGKENAEPLDFATHPSRRTSAG